MRRAVAGVLLALAAAPAAGQGASPYDEAVAARLAGDAARAAALLIRWVAAHPEDADARLQLGYALLALGRLDEAEAQFAEVLRQAPEYGDAREGLALVAQRRAADAERRAFVIAEGSRSFLDGGRADWREAGLTLVAPSGEGGTIAAGGTWYQRFGREDAELAGTVTHRAGEDLWVRLGASVTPSADFRPELGVTMGFDQRLAPGTVASLDASFRRFPLQDILALAPAVTQYFGAVSLTARADAVRAAGDKLRLGGSLRGDWTPAERMRLFVGAAAGPDTDLGVVTAVRSLFAGGEAPVGPRLSVTAGAGQEWRSGAGADRTELRLGLKLAL